jgi:hypothetical protein
VQKILPVNLKFREGVRDLRSPVDIARLGPYGRSISLMYILIYIREVLLIGIVQEAAKTFLAAEENWARPPSIGSRG